MTRARRALACAALVVTLPPLVGCDAGSPRDAALNVDTAYSDPTAPGTILRRGPATPEAIRNPPSAPTVYGAAGQVSVHNGFFVAAPCASAPRVDVGRRQDTILVRMVSQSDTVRGVACPDSARAYGYALLVGQFDPGEYSVRVTHQGDRGRPPLDTVYDDITVQPRR